MDELTIKDIILWHQHPLEECAGSPIIPQYNFEPLAKALIGVEEVTKSVEDLVLLFFEEAKKYSACGANPNNPYAVIRRPPAGWDKLIKKILDTGIEVKKDTVIPIVVPEPIPNRTINAVTNDIRGTAIDGNVGAAGILNVLSNDTLNGAQATPSNVNITEIIPDPFLVLSLNTATGDVNVGTAATGTYTLTYKICDKQEPSNCDTAVVIVRVFVEVIPNVVVAVEDDITTVPIDGTIGGVNVLNVLDNDTFNGQPATLSNIVLTEAIPEGSGVLTLNADGSVDVAPNSAAGTYGLVYTICDINDPGNCSSANVIIELEVANPEPTPDLTCDESFSFSGSTGVKDIVISYGLSVGECGIKFNPASVPDRFQIIYDGAIVADSLYRGSESSEQRLLDIGVPLEEMALGTPTYGEITFNKVNPTPSTAIIRVTAPFEGTYWNIEGICPR